MKVCSGSGLSPSTATCTFDELAQITEGQWPHDMPRWG